MPLTDNQVREVQERLLAMVMDTVRTFEALHQHADELFGDQAPQLQAALDEWLNDFIRKPVAGELHPEVAIYRSSRDQLQRAGFYGAQLAVKERQVTTANDNLRRSLSERVRGFFRRPFSKWVDVINNFLGSLAGATGFGEALKELKDCLRDELPDDH